MNHKPARVLQVLGKLQTGGAETMIMNYYRNINKKEIQFDFIVHGNEIGTYEEEIKKMGGRIYRLPKYRLYNHLNYKKELNEFFRKHKEYKIIHSHIRSTAAIILKIAKKYGIVTISHSHSTSNGIGPESIIKRILQSKIPKYADYFFACSKESAIWLFGKKNADSAKCIIMNNSIDIDKFIYNENERNKIRSELKIDENKVIIGHIGRFVDAKNHDFILRIADKILKKNKEIIFFLCGDGELKNNIQKKIRKMHIDKNFVIIPPQNDINRYYNAFDLFILPSKYEGLGMVLIEAQINGLKCIASNSIPKSAKILDTTIFKQLNIKEWCNEIMNLKYKYERNIDINKFKSYSIKNEVHTLEKFYLSKMNKEE